MSDEMTLRMLITAEAQKAVAELDRTGAAAEKAGKKAQESGKAWETIKHGIEALGIAEGVKKLGEWGDELLKSGEDAESSDKRIQNIARSMHLFGGHAGEVAKRLSELAESQSVANGVDASTIKQTQAKLLTFSQLAKSAGTVGGAFDQTTQAAIDLAAAGFGSATDNATQLGKALQDPIKGMAGLRRVGVTFTDAEQKQIKAMVQHGHAAQAQNMMLKAIERQVGGTAKATATGTQKMRVGWDNLKEQLGKAMLPMFDKVSGFITKKAIPAVMGFVKGMEDGTGNGGKFSKWLKTDLWPILQKAGDFIHDKVIPAVSGFIKGMQNGTGPGGKFRDLIEGIYTALKKTIDWVNQNRSWLAPIAAGILAAVVAWQTYTAISNGVKTAMEVMKAAQMALNLVMAENPIGLVIAILVGLAIALVYAYNHCKTFRDIVNAAFRIVGEAATWMWNNAIGPALRFIVRGIADVIDMYARLLGGLSHIPGFGWARGAADALHRAASKARELADGIRNIPNKSVNVQVNFSSNAWQIQQQVSAAARLAAGITIGTNGTRGGIQARAAGGPVLAGQTYLVGEEGPELVTMGASGTVIPHSKSMRALSGGGVGGGGGNVYITVQGDSDPLGAARQIQRRLIELKRRNGGLALGLS